MLLMYHLVKNQKPLKVKVGEVYFSVEKNGRVQRVLLEPDESGYSPLAPSKEFCKLMEQ